MELMVTNRFSKLTAVFSGFDLTQTSALFACKHNPNDSEYDVQARAQW